jgi:hypothetical protein
MSHFQHDDRTLHAGWCADKTTYAINGECDANRRSFLPDVPPALSSAAPISADQLTRILADPNYGNWGLIIYRFPADSLYPEIQLVKRSGVWMVLVWRAPEIYKPAIRTLEPHQVVRLIWSYIKGEQVFPAEIEAVGSGPAQHRMFFRIH